MIRKPGRLRVTTSLLRGIRHARRGFLNLAGYFDEAAHAARIVQSGAAHAQAMKRRKVQRLTNELPMMVRERIGSITPQVRRFLALSNASAGPRFVREGEPIRIGSGPSTPARLSAPRYISVWNGGEGLTAIGSQRPDSALP